jgi:hypothetical protein
VSPAFATNRELLADQRPEPLARVGAEARAHLLDDHERDRHEHHQEQRPVGELRPCAGVGEDAARVVAGVGRDQARPRDRDEREHAPEPTAWMGRRCDDVCHSDTSLVMLAVS